MRQTRAWPSIGLVLCVTLPLGCGDKDPVPTPPTPVKARVVEQQGREGAARYSANITPRTQVDLAFKAGGYVRELLQVRGADGRQRDVQEGDRVAKGTVLARLRESDSLVKRSQAQSQQAEARASAEEAKSQLVEAEANREQAKLDFERASNLFATQSATKADYDAAKTRFEVAEATVEKAKAQVQAAQAKFREVGGAVEEADIAVRDVSLRAPMDGVVLKRAIEVGTLASPGTVAFVLADTTAVKAIFGVSDSMMERLKTGTELTITVEALHGSEFSGRITRIAPSADPKSHAFEVELTIPNPRNQLKAGMIVTVTLEGPGPAQARTVVPLSAIVRPAGKSDNYALFIVEGQEDQQVARLRQVKLGEVLGNTVEVKEGVKAGDPVIVTGAPLVSDGDRVRITP